MRRSYIDSTAWLQVIGVISTQKDDSTEAMQLGDMVSASANVETAEAGLYLGLEQNGGREHDDALEAVKGIIYSFKGSLSIKVITKIRALHLSDLPIRNIARGKSCIKDDSALPHLSEGKEQPACSFSDCIKSFIEERDQFCRAFSIFHP